MNSIQAQTYNLRKELARHCWDARKGTLDVFAANENTRDLVAMFPEDMIELADKLQHKVMNQITKKYGKIQCTKKGIDMSDMRVPVVKTRDYLGAVQLPENYIG